MTVAAGAIGVAPKPDDRGKPHLQWLRCGVVLNALHVDDSDVPSVARDLDFIHINY